jgi:NDP-sugar pyrophosphorylase family protein
MLPLAGRPLLEHLVGLVREHGVTRLAINLHYKPEAIVEHFGDGRRFGVEITYSLEPSLLGSAGAAKRLEWYLDEPFFVLYGDVLTDLDLQALAGRHRRWQAAVTLAVYEVDDPGRVGIVETAPDGRIRRFIEKPRPGQTSSKLANAGVYVVEPGVLAHVPAGQRYDFGEHLFPDLLRRGLALRAHQAAGYVLDIGSVDRYRQAETDLRAGRCRLAGPPGAATPA